MTRRVSSYCPKERAFALKREQKHSDTWRNRFTSGFFHRLSVNRTPRCTMPDVCGKAQSEQKVASLREVHSDFQKVTRKHTRPHFSCVPSVTCKWFCRLPRFRWHHLHGNWRRLLVTQGGVMFYDVSRSSFWMNQEKGDHDNDDKNRPRHGGLIRYRRSRA